MKIFEVTESTVPAPTKPLKDQVKDSIEQYRQSRRPGARDMVIALNQLVQQQPRELTTKDEYVARAAEMVAAKAKGAPTAPAATPTPTLGAVADTDGVGVKATVKKSARRGKSAFQKGQEIGRRVVAATKTTRRPKTRRF